MDSAGSLRSLYKPMIAMVRNYLSKELGSSDLRVAEDFERDGVILRTAPETRLQYRLFLSHEFLSDFDVEHGASLLRSWRVSERAKALPRGVTLFITTEGTFTERTEGRTLRDAASEFDTFIPSNEARKALYDRVFSVPVDGVPLGELPMEMKGDPDLYSSYSDEFAGFIGAAYLLDAAGFRDFELRRPPSQAGVDLEIRLNSGERVFLDLKRAIDPVERRSDAMREQINVALRRALRDDEALRSAIEGHFVQITLSQAPLEKRGVDGVVREIQKFVTTTAWPEVADRTLIDFDSYEYPMLSSSGAHVYVALGPTYLSVQEGAKTMDRHAPVREIIRVLREESRKTFRPSPLWLGISLSEFAPLFGIGDVFDRVDGEIDLKKTPFDRIIIGSAEFAKTYKK
jgi:hypothetical protein